MTTVSTHIQECQLRFIQECQLLSAVHLRAEILLKTSKRGALLSRMWSQKGLVTTWKEMFSKSNGVSPKCGVAYGVFVWFLFPFLPHPHGPYLLLNGSGKTLHRLFRKYLSCRPSRVLSTELTTCIFNSSSSRHCSARRHSACRWSGVQRTPLVCRTSQDALGCIVLGMEK